MSKHSITAELLDLQQRAVTPFEHELVALCAKFYGLLCALQLCVRIQTEEKD